MRNITIRKIDKAYYDSWREITAILRKELGDSVFRSWISHLIFKKIDGSDVVFECPSRFIKEWISSNYLKRIAKLFNQRHSNLYSVEIIVNKLAPKNTSQINSTDSAPIEQSKVLNVNSKISSPIDTRFTFDDFVVGDSNKLAYKAAKFVAENEEVVSGYNPLFLHGGVGLGKTHLMHAIALYIRDNQPDRKVIYLSAEKFMYQFVRSLRNNDIMNFKESFREVDLLMIDDVQFICDKESTQEEFFHTLNALLDANKQIVISSDKSPSELSGMKERLKSRLGWGMVADIAQTTYDLRANILKSKISKVTDASIENSVIDFLSHKIKSNVRELEGALNKLIAHSALTNKTITIEYTKDVLSDLIKSNDKRVTILEIQKIVAKYFGIKMSDMSSSSRSRSVARPRQIAMYLCKELTVRSLSEIGIKFAKKDHTTVIHAVKKITQLLDEDVEVYQAVNEIKDIINHN